MVVVGILRVLRVVMVCCILVVFGVRPGTTFFLEVVMAAAKNDGSMQTGREFELKQEDDPRIVAERYLNRIVKEVMELEVKLRQARADERRARAELGRLS